MFAVPLVGWAMLSAAGYPIQLVGGFHLPPILPHDGALRRPLAVAHLFSPSRCSALSCPSGAALTHALVFKDGVFRSMVK